MIKPVCTLLLAALLTFTAAGEVPTRLPQHRGMVAVVRSAEQPEGLQYLAFPAVLMVEPDVIWVSYKAGRGHASDPGAPQEIVEHHLRTGETRLLQRLEPVAPKLYQMAEMVRFPDGNVALYLDVQAIGHDRRHYRTGVEEFRWDAARRQFVGPQMLKPIAGVTYGYPFDFVTRNATTWQLIMAFGYLPGGRWSVDAIRSDDAGKSWSFVRNLSEEFGDLRLNESGFIAHGDEFIVTTRGYDSRERLHRVDRDFRVLKQVDLTETYPFINSYVGRPRLFSRDGKGYLIGRNWTLPLDAPAERGGTPGAMKLSLFRFDLETLEIESHVVLDNDEEANVTDAYYAVPVFSNQDGRTMLHVITYKGLNRQAPDIVRLDYRWDEVK